MTPQDFTHWLTHAQPGERMIYHTGRLALDREHDPALHRLARRVWEAGEGGFVELSQFRIQERSYAYLVRRTEEFYA